MRLRNCSFGLIASFLGFAGVVHAQEDPPLFAAFKAYCLKAGGDPEQVKLAVEMRGGKLAEHPGGATDTPWPMTVTNWDITTHGHKMILSVGTSHPPRGGDSTNCVIDSFSDETDSMEALRKWAGVPRDPNHTFPEFYNFYLDGGAHKAIQDTDAFRVAAKNGNIWSLALIGKSSLQFARTLSLGPK